jgi:hypothetical protein
VVSNIFRRYIKPEYFIYIFSVNYLVFFLHGKNLFVSLHPLKGEKLVEGFKRDRIPAARRREEEVE